MNLLVTYTNADGTLADVHATQIAPEDFEGAGYEDDILVSGLDLTLDVTWARVVKAWIAAGGVPAPYVAPPAPVPASISDRQFFQQLAVQGIITQDDALAAVRTGAIPAALQTLINGLPAQEQFGATMLISGAVAFEHNHPLTIEIGAAYGWTSDQLDALFRAAAAL